MLFSVNVLEDSQFQMHAKYCKNCIEGDPVICQPMTAKTLLLHILNRVLSVLLSTEKLEHKRPQLLLL